MADYPGTAVLSVSVLMVVVVLAAWFDVRERRIPNLLVFPAAVAGLCVNAMQGWSGLWFSTKGLLIGFGLLFVPYLLRVMGAGDVKFLAAIGTFLGGAGVIRVFLLTLMAYPIISLGFLIQQKKLRLTLRRFFKLICRVGALLVPSLGLYAAHLDASDNPEMPSATSPFGLAISAGTTLALFTNFLR